MKCDTRSTVPKVALRTRSYGLNVHLHREPLFETNVSAACASFRADHQGVGFLCGVVVSQVAEVDVGSHLEPEGHAMLDQFLEIGGWGL